MRASLGRAAATRRNRPELARRSRAWGMVGAAAWPAAAAAEAAWARGPAQDGRRRLPWRRGIAWWTLTWLMLQWHLGMVEGPAGERRRSLAPADALTLLRFWLAPGVLVARDRRALGALTALGAAADLIDGRLARRSGTTRLGRDLDRTADIAFFGAAVVAAAQAGLVAPPVAAGLILRYGAAFTFACVHYFRRGVAPTVGSDRWASPLVVLGLLAGAAGFRRTAGTTVGAASALPLVWHGWRIPGVGGRRPW